MDVDGKVAVLTGSASGVGLAAAEVLAAQGALPVIVDLPGRDAVLPPSVAKIARFVAADETDEDALNVCMITPGLFETPLLVGMTAAAKEALSRAVPHPPRLGEPHEFGHLVAEMVRKPYLDGETIRLDGAPRLGPR
jgi:NAD(P)-dependent dehydrogenase (short-subunit alcohol dehydrogenase family)